MFGHFIVRGLDAEPLGFVTDDHVIDGRLSVAALEDSEAAGQLREHKLLREHNPALFALEIGLGDGAVVDSQEPLRAEFLELRAVVEPDEGDDHHDSDRDHQRLPVAAEQVYHEFLSVGVLISGEDVA